MNASTSTRLGQILLDKGLITTEQLSIALSEQQQRRLHASPALDQSLSLGEILIELGFIDHRQLKRGLSWQSMLRKAAIAVSFCAPLMTFSSGAFAATSSRPSFTFVASSSSSVAKSSPTFKTSSSISSVAFSSSSVKSSSSSSSSSSKPSLSGVSSSSSSISDYSALKMSDIYIVVADYDHVQLKWTALAGNNITSYKIFRDQVLVESLEANRESFDDYNVASGKTYLYGVSVGDVAGNWSPIKSILVQTKTAPKGFEVKSSSSSVVSSGSSRSSSSLSNAVQSTSSVPVSVSSSSIAASSVASSTTSAVVSSSSISSSAPVSSASSRSSSSAPASSSSSAASSVTSSSASSVAPVTVIGSANLSWVAPNMRENGNTLDITEVGGYELRYRKTTDNAYSYVTINDAWTNIYNFNSLNGTYIFQIAAFDKNGLYSNFIDIRPQ